MAQKHRSLGSFFSKNCSVINRTAEGDKGIRSSRSGSKNYKLIVKKFVRYLKTRNNKYLLAFMGCNLDLFERDRFKGD